MKKTNVVKEARQAFNEYKVELANELSTIDNSSNQNSKMNNRLSENASNSMAYDPKQSLK